MNDIPGNGAPQRSTESMLASIHAQMPLTARLSYLNTGTAGPLAQRTMDALTAGAALDFGSGRGAVSSFAAMMNDIEALRSRLAMLCGATVDEIAITHHTTEGVNIVAHGMSWQAGDEIVTTTAEHEGGLLPLFVLQQRFAVRVRVVETTVDDSAVEIVDKIAAAIGPRTRLVACSHVNWNSGLRLPIARIAAMAHEHGALTLIDGAQSAGAMTLDLGASGVDFFAAPAQKWLCGPEGLGILFVSARALDQLTTTFVGYSSLETSTSYDFQGNFDLAPGARRFEVGTVYRPGISAMIANLDWLAEDVGWPWIHARIADLNAQAHVMLSGIDGVEVITRADAGSGLLSFALPGYEPKRVVAKLEQLGVVIRSLPDPSCLRLSTGFYNSRTDLECLVAALGEVSKLAPEDLPPPLF